MIGLVTRFCVVFVLGLGIAGCATTTRTLPTPEATVNAEYAKAWADQQTRETERKTPAPTRPRTPTPTKPPGAPYSVMVRGYEVVCREISYEYVSMADLGKVTALQHVANTITLRLNNPSLYVSAHDAENALFECGCISTRNCKPIGIGATPTPAPQVRNRSTPARTPGTFVWARDRTPTPSPTAPMPTPTPTPIDYDEDNDGLIEIRTLAQLDAKRWDYNGDGRPTPNFEAEYQAAFPWAVGGMGCPADGCYGYELVADLDFDTNGNGYIDNDDAYYNDGEGWKPLGRPNANERISRLTDVGVFEGNGHTIANLWKRPLFYEHWGVIRNVVLSDVYVVHGCGALLCVNQGGTVSGITASGEVGGETHEGDRVGGLVGFCNGGTVTNSTANVRVWGRNDVGGLVGSGCSIIDSTATGEVHGNGNVGGLVGSGGSITNSASTGNVFGHTHVGGLVGYSSGSISDSSASGNVFGTGTYHAGGVGGLAGTNDGYTITGSTATGNVLGFASVGGLVGFQPLGEIIDSSASGNVTGDHATNAPAHKVNNNIGGLVGNNRGAIRDSEASGFVSGENQIGGLVGLNNGHIERSTASGDVKGVEYIGGLVGWHQGDTIERSEASGYVEGYSYVGGLVGATTGFIRDSEANGDIKGVEYVGGLAGGVGGDRESVGFEIGGSLSDTRANGYVSGAYYVGGLAGWNSGTIKDSTAKGYVSGKYQVDALVGANEGGQITSSSGTGKVSEPR